jgi:hypothetical protein
LPDLLKKAKPGNPDQRLDEEELAIEVTEEK